MLVVDASCLCEVLVDGPISEAVRRAQLLGRAWELRVTVRAADAMYVALAEALGAPLVTLDARLGRAPGPLCAVEVLSVALPPS